VFNYVSQHPEAVKAYKRYEYTDSPYGDLASYMFHMLRDGYSSNMFISNLRDYVDRHIQEHPQESLEEFALDVHLWMQVCVENGQQEVERLNEFFPDCDN
jgi:hypothetical protein